jgi:O-antigen/teichoic acid export membrane protein
MNAAPAGTRQFLINIFWNWASVLANFFLGFILSPILIRKLGADMYGIWILVFSIVEYLWIFDLGLRSAVVNRVSSYSAVKDQNSINQVMTAAVFYLGCTGAILGVLTLVFHQWAAGVFNISQAYRNEFSTLLLLAGLGVAANYFLITYQAGLEAVHCFKQVNRNYIFTLLLRCITTSAVLLVDGGLLMLGAVMVLSQLTGGLLNVFSLRRAMPALKLKFNLLNRERIHEVWSFGLKSVGAGTALLFLNQAPALIIGLMMPEAYVGFYTLAARLLNYAVDFITRIGFVTSPNTSHLLALGRRDEVFESGIFINRYCLTFFLPFAVFLSGFGKELIGLWAGPRFAVEAAPLLPAFLLSCSIATAAQFNTSSILYGLARQGDYGKALLVESIFLLILFPLALKYSGLQAAAWVSSILMIASRAVAAPAILSRALDQSLLRYLGGIYLRPLLTLPLQAGVCLVLRYFCPPSPGWVWLAMAGMILGATQIFAGYWLCLNSEHRKLLEERLLRKRT